MRCYFDTSAVIPLVLNEERSVEIRELWPDLTEQWAWDWIIVEAEAALIRQKADAVAWREWARISRSLTLIELNPQDQRAWCAFNRGIGLRAADAAHLFLFDRLSRQLDNLQLVTFDREMSQAAAETGMSLHALSQLDL
jgi:predicted nucleic acid-binding protein